ncbi:hypothetical protein HYH02_010964 [Chlamydomonas schloesseri]|uniref:Uncharacterized protein n=1 Tax=Chlamydomonas schloesseri TaxID=2026947 RepID=A0A835W7C9_9CHLO|nr:hypothetical protein HYH02_010964 [Chlamydomonas schloesseri]|eukprot:KAG2438266.1 hypothetical protein HYH02_010964 [Chlamydomonas schloesseri]
MPAMPITFGASKHRHIHSIAPATAGRKLRALTEAYPSSEVREEIIRVLLKRPETLLGLTPKTVCSRITAIENLLPPPARLQVAAGSTLAAWKLVARQPALLKVRPARLAAKLKALQRLTGR